MDRKCRYYVWGSIDEKRKVALVSWEKICKPKKNGALNIKSCKLWNIASVRKRIWQLATKADSLWIRWVYGVYMRGNQDIWIHTPPVDNIWYWRKLNSIKSVMTNWYNNGTYCLTINGAYSVSRSYISLLGSMEKMLEADLVWNNIMLPRHRFIVWLANQEKLLTKERLIRVHIPVDDGMCCLCDENKVESQLHLFIECSWTVKLQDELEM
ncbi:uncharacterized protein [Nicotiana tomentosiformis]|uniref:uncharacterized protein n=1 Tax=Nicotiana tomentosiformis TaxID=4098 RepID=UPI00388C71A0